MRDEPLNVRLLLHVSASQREQINDFRFRERIGAEAEAVRQLIEAGLVATGVTQAAPAEPANDDRPPPYVPHARELKTQVVLAERIIPYLQKTGKRTYSLGDVLGGVWNQTEDNHKIGYDAVVKNLFKALGWKAQTVRRNGITQRLFHAPD